MRPDRLLFNTLHFTVLFAMLTLCTLSNAARAQNPITTADMPEGLFLIGLTEGGWRFFIAEHNQLRPVSAIEHPRGGSYHPGLNRIAYLGADNRFYEYDLDAGTTRDLSASGPDDSRYSQPRYSANGDVLLVVELPDGRSRRTNILGIDTTTHDVHYLVRKRTAQFEPQMMSSDALYYTTAICVDDCEGMIWELWHRDLNTAQQRQLTLMNAVARQPHLGYDGWLYFSSNANGGHYNIWRMQPDVGSPPEQLTFGADRDSAPATDRNGNLFFLRKSRSTSELMVLSDGMLHRVALPDTVEDIRHLEIFQ